MKISDYVGLFGGVGNQFIRAGIILVILLVVFRLILGLFMRVFGKISSKTKSDLDDIILARVSKPLTFVAFVAALWFSVKELVLVESIMRPTTLVVDSLVVIAVGYVIYLVLDIVLIRAWTKFAENTESDLDDNLINLGHSALKAAFIVLIVLYVLNFWGVEIGPLLAGLGIAGLAVALALQPTLANIFSGISLIIDQTLRAGDVVKLESGDMGSVDRVGLRTTRIKTFDNEMIIVPNSNLANSSVHNFFQPDLSIRASIDFGVEYGVDPEYVKKLAIEEVEKVKIIDKNQEVRVLFTSMGDSALNFKVMFWVDDIAKKWPAHQEAISRIYRRLYEEKIGIPYPQQTVWLRDEGKAKGPDPKDSKFKSVKGKYYSAFGREYKEKKRKEKKLENKSLRLDLRGLKGLKKGLKLDKKKDKGIEEEE